MAPASTSGGKTTRNCQATQNTSAKAAATPRSDQATRPATANRSHIGRTVPDPLGTWAVGGAYPRDMDDRTEPPTWSAGLVPRIVLAGIVVFVALTVLGWIVSAALAVLRTLAVLAVVGAVLWAVLAARRD